MSKVARVISQVAAIVATVAAIAAIFVAPQLVPVFLEIAAIASAVAAVAGAIAMATAKPPDAKGSVNQVLIGRNLPVPYAIGRTYAGGFQVYDNSNGEDNKDRSQIMVVSAAGPIEGFESLKADYSTINLDESPGGGRISGEATGWFENHLWVDSRLGLRPDTALSNDPGRASLRYWDSTHKLSGFAAYRVTMKFDKDGERYSSGIPQWGVVFKGPKVYDPRKDSTYPGGSGTNRWNDEATFQYGTGSFPSAENPAIAALNYARGRFIEKNASGTPYNPPIKLLGCGFEFADIYVDQFVELANICDANGWKAGGLIYEAPGASKWDNLKRLLAAAAAEPTWTGGKLGCKISAPRTPVVTIGLPDMADGELSVQAMKSWRDKINTVVPRIRLEAHRWEYTQLEEVTSSTYLAEDGEPKSVEVQFDLCQWEDQGAELAAYRLVNGREFGPIVLPLKPAFMVYQVGEAVTLNLPELGLENQRAIITSRQIDPSTGAVTFQLESETNAKHAFALGRTGVAPPTPTLITPQEMDETAGGLQLIDAQLTANILNSWPTNLTMSVSNAGVFVVSNHTRIYNDKNVAVTGATITTSGAVAGDYIGIFYDQCDRTGGAVTYQWARLPGGVGEFDFMFASSSNPCRHFVGMLPVPAVAAPPTGGGSGGGSGGGGGGAGGGWMEKNYEV